MFELKILALHFAVLSKTGELKQIMELIEQAADAKACVPGLNLGRLLIGKPITALRRFNR